MPEPVTGLLYVQPKYNLVVKIHANGKGEISSQLKLELCDSFTQTEAEYNIASGQVDALESLILALACEGINVGSAAFARALEVSLDAIVNNS